MSAEMGVVCSLVSLERGVSAGNWGLALESLGNGTSAGMVYRLGTHSGTGHQRGSLKSSSVSRRMSTAFYS